MRTTFAKTYGIKMRCYCENMSGTWELFALTPFPPPKTQLKKIKYKTCMESQLSKWKVNNG
jgi:hypothetical protein